MANNAVSTASYGTMPALEQGQDSVTPGRLSRVQTKLRSIWESLPHPSVAETCFSCAVLAAAGITLYTSLSQLQGGQTSPYPPCGIMLVGGSPSCVTAPSGAFTCHCPIDDKDHTHYDIPGHPFATVTHAEVQDATEDYMRRSVFTEGQKEEFRVWLAQQTKDEAQSMALA